jgi:hypothetical protein
MEKKNSFKIQTYIPKIFNKFKFMKEIKGAILKYELNY